MKKILIIDDDIIFIETLTKILSKDYEIKYLKNPEDLFSFPELNKLDLIITDYRMPQMTGKEVVLKLKKLNPEIKIVMVTAYPKEYLLSQALVENLPVVNYLRKPIKKSDIDEIFNPPICMYDSCSNSRSGILNSIKDYDTIEINIQEKDLNWMENFKEEDFYRVVDKWKEI